MNKPRSTLSKSLFYLFDLYLVILMVVEMLHCIFLWKEGRTVIFLPLGWWCPREPAFKKISVLVLFLFCPQPPQEGL